MGCTPCNGNGNGVSSPEERHDGMVSVTWGGGISKGRPARNFWLKHRPWGWKGRRRIQSGFKEGHRDGDYKEVEG